MNLTNMLEQAKEAREAGFTKAATELERKADRARKLAVAYEHFRYVTQGDIDGFQKKLQERTARPATEKDAKQLKAGHAYHLGATTILFDRLNLTPMEAYAGLPPGDVLTQVKAAKALNCFDTFEVAEVVPDSTQIQLPDPIVFGLVEGCTDRFFVGEWGSDVSINDLIGKHQG